MTDQEKRDLLRRKIWQIANEVRGAVDGWDFKQFVLGALFYRFISENFTSYIEAGDDSVKYAKMADSDIPDEVKVDAIKTKGYFIYPSQLFANLVASAKKNESLNTELAAVFAAIEASASGFPSEEDIKGLFADFDTTSNRLGNTVKDKNSRLTDVLKGVAGLELGDFSKNEGDLFGDAYEFLISNYAANAGKSGGEFFTPTHVSKLIAQLALHNQSSVNKIYDPACGSGSLLLQAQKHFDAHIVEDGFFGQEINHTTYNLARMNMFLHNINYDKFNIQLGDTLIKPHFGDDKPFDAIVSNPPYSLSWNGTDDPTLINDERFAPAGVLAPKSKADFAFVLHALSYLSSKGRAAIVCFPGIFYRGGAEKKIRKYLVDNNYVETVISLAPNLFYGTTIAVTILVLAKNKTDTKVQFIDASGEEFFAKKTNNNVMDDRHIKAIIEMFDSKVRVAHVAESVPSEKIAENDYNLSVSAYVEPKDTSVATDIIKLNAELGATIEKIDQLRTKLTGIISEIGDINDQGFLERLLDGVDVEWEPLGKIADLRRGRVMSKGYLAENAGKFPVYSSQTARNGMIGKIGTFDFDGEFVSWTTDGANAGTVFYRTGKFSITNVCGVLKSNGHSPLSHKFLFHWLSVKAKQHVVSGMGNPKLMSHQVEKIPIPIPCPQNSKKSLEIQAEIVKFLDAFTRLNVELSLELNAELNARKKHFNHYRDVLLSFPESRGRS